MSAPDTGSSLIFADDDEAALRHARRILAILVALLAAGLVWAWAAVLDEVSTGQAKVVPTSREQVIQSLEGGILASLEVQPDQVVEAGQVLARLDPTRNAADVEETASRYRAMLAMAARLTAEITGDPLTFPPLLDDHPTLTTIETRLYTERRRALEGKLALIDTSMELTRTEREVNQRLQQNGATSAMDVLRLDRQLNELEMQRAETSAEYLIKAQQDLSQTEAELAQLRPVVQSRADVVQRLTLRAPLRGIVKNIEVSTIGGVVPPNGKLMDIVPLDDRLMIEARILPRDIAFIRPGLRATVKVSAYDYSVYGALEGQVETISADTIQDETDPRTYYYRVFIRTGTDALVTRAGTRHPIVPGMLANVDIHTGQKSVLDYLLKPFNQASEALRER